MSARVFGTPTCPSPVCLLAASCLSSHPAVKAHDATCAFGACWWLFWTRPVSSSSRECDRCVNVVALVCSRPPRRIIYAGKSPYKVFLSHSRRKWEPRFFHAWHFFGLTMCCHSQCVGAGGVTVCREKTLFLSIFLYGVRQTASPLSHGSVLKERDQTVRWLTAAADIYQPSASFWPPASEEK